MPPEGQSYVSEPRRILPGGQNILIRAPVVPRQWPGSSPRPGLPHSGFSAKGKNSIEKVGPLVSSPKLVWRSEHSDLSQPWSATLWLFCIKE